MSNSNSDCVGTCAGQPDPNELFAELWLIRTRIAHNTADCSGLNQESCICNDSPYQTYYSCDGARHGNCHGGGVRVGESATQYLNTGDCTPFLRHQSHFTSLSGARLYAEGCTIEYNDASTTSTYKTVGAV